MIVITSKTYHIQLGIFLVILSSKSNIKIKYKYNTYGINNGSNANINGLYLNA